MIGKLGFRGRMMSCEGLGLVRRRERCFVWHIQHSERYENKKLGVYGHSDGVLCYDTVEHTGHGMMGRKVASDLCCCYKLYKISEFLDVFTHCGERDGEVIKLRRWSSSISPSPSLLLVCAYIVLSFYHSLITFFRRSFPRSFLPLFASSRHRTLLVPFCNCFTTVLPRVS